MGQSDRREPFRHYPRVLTIAGSEPLGSAGMQADVKAISACGAYAAGAVTCIVDEDTRHVKRVYPLPVELVTEQVRSFLEDVGADAVKIGFLPSAGMIKAVARTLRACDVHNVVLDPVMVTSSGERIVEDEAIGALKEYLFPLVRIITPNTREAALLLGPNTTTDWVDACGFLSDVGCSVVLKSIPAPKDCLQDLFCDADTGKITTFTKKRVDTRNINGTGCTFSSAIAAFLAQGFGLAESVGRAEEYIQGAINSGADYVFGTGFGPVDHFYRCETRCDKENW